MNDVKVEWDLGAVDSDADDYAVLLTTVSVY